MLLFLSPIKVNASTSMKINDLIEHALDLDGQTVTITAEAIGEKMDRTGGTWVNVNDTSNAIGIWMDKTEAEKITSYGSYKSKGDELEIIGVFNRACTQHGGEPDVHSISIRVINKGYTVKEDVPLIKITITLVLVATSLVFVTLFMNQSKYIKTMSAKNNRKNGNSHP